MWTPDVKFVNQVSLTKTESAIKNDLDAIVSIGKLPCQEETNQLCQAMALHNESESIKIFFRQTINVEVNCPNMHFAKFPFDTQTCLFLVGDIHVRENPNNFKWGSTFLVKGNNLTSTEFELSLEDEMDSKVKTGFRMRMERKTAVYIYTYFVPCGLMVVVSWISFSVNVEAVPGRLGLLLTLLLMTINLNNSAAQTIPSSEKICPLIIWIQLSMSFICLALVEYFVILLMLRFGRKVGLTSCTLNSNLDIYKHALCFLHLFFCPRLMAKLNPQKVQMLER